MGGDRISKGRPKVPLGPGFSQMAWMKLMTSGKDLTAGIGAIEEDDDEPPEFTMQEVRRHNTRQDMWMVLRRKVYCITEYLSYHPGSIEELVRAAGDDGTAMFDEVHPWVNAEAMLENCLVGVLKKSPPASSHVALQPDDWLPFTLTENFQINHNMHRLRFALPPDKPLGLSAPGEHLQVAAKQEGKLLIRAYTPISPIDQAGSVDLLVKTYPDANLAKILCSLQPGDSIPMRGPRGSFRYATDGSGTFWVPSRRQQPNMSVRQLGMVAAGSGMTPMLQILHGLQQQLQTHGPDKLPETITLMLANHAVEDIVLQKELETLATCLPRCSIHHCLSDSVNAPLASNIHGRVDQGLLYEYMPPKTPEDDTLLLICGPPLFNRMILEWAKDAKFQDVAIHVF